MVDSLDGLRHDAVISSDHEHDDVGHLGTARTHGRERLMARRIDKGDLTAVDVDDRRADVLGDAACLARDDAGMADGVKQRGLAVVDVAHDRDDRRTRLQILRRVVVDHRELLFRRDNAHLAIHVVGNELDQFVGHGLRERQHLAKHEQTLDHVVRLHADKLGELGDRGALGNLDDGIVQDKRRVEALFERGLGGALALLLLALLLALLTTAFAGTFLRGGLDCSTGFSEHLVALELFGLNGHLRVAVLARFGTLDGQLGHVRLEAVALRRSLLRALAASLLGCALALARAVLCGRLARFLLAGKARLLAFDLGQKGAESRRARKRRQAGSLLFRGCGVSGLGSLLFAAMGSGKALFDRTLLRDLARKRLSARTLLCLGSFARHALLLAFDLVLKRAERRVLQALRRLLSLLLDGSVRIAARGGTAAARALSALRLAHGALFLDRSAALGGFGSLLFGGMAALFVELLRLLAFQLASTLLDLGLKILANLLDVSVGKDACMAFGGDLHPPQAVEQLFAAHPEFFRQLMYTHAGHPHSSTLLRRARLRTLAQRGRNHLRTAKPSRPGPVSVQPGQPRSRLRSRRTLRVLQPAPSRRTTPGRPSCEQCGKERASRRSCRTKRTGAAFSST